MPELVSIRKELYDVDLEPDTYYGCRHGRSKNQRFYAGSHKETDLEVAVKARETKTYYLVGCKQTGTPPFCDDTHNRL